MSFLVCAGRRTVCHPARDAGSRGGSGIPGQARDDMGFSNNSSLLYPFRKIMKNT